MDAIHPPIIGKQGALSCIHSSEYAACRFIDAFAFADESAGYKTTPKSMTPDIG